MINIYTEEQLSGKGKNMIQVEKATPFPPNSNPFHHAAFNMGTRVASNVMVMHPTHNNERAGIIYIVNTETGERIALRFAEFKDISMVGIIMEPKS